MEERILKVVINRSGDGHITPRVTIPLKWFEEMGLSEEDREVHGSFNKQTREFIIKKSEKNKDN